MKNLFEYNGYHGSAAVSMEDGCLYGEILFINDMVLYHADTFKNLEKEFKIAVDDYIATCKLVDKEPEKPFKGSFNVRVSPDLHRKAAISAVNEDITLNELVAKALNSYVNKHEQPVTIAQHNHHHVHQHISQTVSRFKEPFENNGEEPAWTISPAIMPTVH